MAGLIRDEEAHLHCHPTNLAFRENVLFTTNLGCWHITAIERWRRACRSTEVMAPGGKWQRAGSWAKG
jgi:hypothetical protein